MSSAGENEFSGTMEIIVPRSFSFSPTFNWNARRRLSAYGRVEFQQAGISSVPF